LRGNEFRNTVHLPVGQVHGAADVLERSLRRHGSEGDDLRDVGAAVFSGDVFDHFAAAPHAEIDVDIGHRYALRIQEALEQQIVLHRIDVGNLQRVADQASRGGTPSRTHGNSLRTRVADKIPDDQKISGVFHLLDHADFVRQPGFVFGERLAEQAGLRASLQHRDARSKPLARHGREIGVYRVSLGHLKIREGIFHRFDLYVASLGNRHGALERLGKFSEHLRHFLGGLEKELVGGEFHAVRVAHGLAGLNAEQHFLGVGIGMFQVMAIVGGHQGNSGFLGERHDLRIDALFDVQALILNFEKKITFSKDVAQAVGRVARLGRALFHQVFRYSAAQARRKRDQAAAVFRQQVIIYSRLVIKAFEKPRGNQLDEIAIAFCIFAEQHEMIRAALSGLGRRIGRAVRGVARGGFPTVVPASLGDVHFATDDRLHAARLCRLVKGLRSEKIAVVGDGNGGHFSPGRFVDDFL
jgi:hypothetical protein